MERNIPELINAAKVSQLSFVLWVVAFTLNLRMTGTAKPRCVLLTVSTLLCPLWKSVLIACLGSGFSWVPVNILEAHILQDKSLACFL